MTKIESVMEDQEYQLLRETVAAFAAKELAPHAEELDLDRDPALLTDLASRASGMGLLAALVPEQKGGGGLDEYAFCAALEEIAVQEAGFAASLLVHNAAIYPVSFSAVELDIRDSYPACLAYPGKVSISNGNLQGRAPFAYNAQGCPLMTVLPADEGGALAALLEPSQGLEIKMDPYPMGLRAARPGSIDFTSAPASRIISEPDLTGSVSRILFLGIAAIAIGIIRNSLSKAYDYARQRYQAGKMIIEHQQLRIFLAEMIAAVEQARSAVKNACETREIGAAVAAWLLATDRAVKAATDGVQIHGGYGYMRDYGMERLMRDSKYCQMYPMTSQAALLRLLELYEKE
jgi:acyl-CoA dehydrogenase